MKYIFYIFLLLSPFFVKAQEKNKINAYGQMTAILNKGEFFGGGTIIGASINNKIGVGLGAEAYMIEKGFITFAKPYFFDLRYFLKSQKIYKPFFALNVGDFNWKDESLYKITSSDYSKIIIEGNLMIGAEGGFWLSKNNKQSGLLFCLAYKNVNFKTRTIPSIAIPKEEVSNKGEGYVSIKLGFKF